MEFRSPKPREGHTADEVVSLARRLGFPVVLKVVSPQITHKTDVGGVELNLANEEQVRQAYDEMLGKRAAGSGPTPRFAAVTVQPMVSLPGGIELIIGAEERPRVWPGDHGRDGRNRRRIVPRSAPRPAAAQRASGPADARIAAGLAAA